MDTRIQALDMALRILILDTQRIQIQDTLAYSTFGFCSMSWIRRIHNSARSCLVVRARSPARATTLTANNVKLFRENLFCGKSKIGVAQAQSGAIVEALERQSA